MSTILYEWEFANYLCRVMESEPGIVHFEQARKESGGDPRVMEFQRTATPMGAANEIIQLHRALAEAKMLNRDLAAFYQGYQEDRNRRERELEELRAAYETSHASRVHADEAVLRLEADLEAARERVVEAKLEGKIEALDDLWKPVRRDQTGKTVECTWADGVTPQYVYAEIDRIAREIANLPKPAVRAAWEGK